MRDEIAAAHRRLDALFEGAREALARGVPEAARRVLAELQEALADHFEQEDRLYYPAIGSLRPEHRDSVERFATDHGRFLDQLERVAERVRARSLADAARAFEDFALDFAGHEAGEEALLEALRVEVEAAG